MGEIITKLDERRVAQGLRTESDHSGQATIIVDFFDGRRAIAIVSSDSRPHDSLLALAGSPASERREKPVPVPPFLPKETGLSFLPDRLRRAALRGVQTLRAVLETNGIPRVTARSEAKLRIVSGGMTPPLAEQRSVSKVVYLLQ